MREPMQKHYRKSQPKIAALLLACGLASLPSHAKGQTPAAPSTPAAPPAQEFQGCVQASPTDKTVLVLNTEAACATLTGKFTATQLDGHQVDLKGVLTPHTRTVPASIHVDTVVSVGKACSNVCSLRPPGTRGLGKGGEIPGKQGGTPGEAPTQPPPPQ
jgi:hypothetical protein